MPDFATTPHVMSPELRDIIQRSRWHLGAVKAVAALLPADDLELDRLIERAVAVNEIPGLRTAIPLGRRAKPKSTAP